MKISLAIIAKDETDQINRILKDYKKYFDEVCIAIDDETTYKQLSEQNEDPTVKLYLYSLSEQEKEKGYVFFDRKRNYLARQVTSDYYFRLDTDDAISSPENIRKVAEKAKAHNVSIIYCWYEYSRDQWGNVHAAHYRETIVKKSDNLTWQKRIHENIVPKQHAGHNIVIEESIKIIHLITEEHVSKAGDRNLKYLLDEYNEDKENADPRTIAYIGRMLLGIGEHDKAQYFLEKHIEKSGWDEDRYMSWCMLAEISLGRKEYKDALGCCYEALSERPEYPDAYFKIHEIYFAWGKWKEAVHWGELGFKYPMPKTFMLLDPAAYTWRPMLSMAHCLLQLDKIEEAREFFSKVEEMVPTLKYVVDNKSLYDDAYYSKRYLDHFYWILNYLREKDSSKVGALFESIPKSLETQEGLARLKTMNTPGKVWDKESIVIYCGNTPGEWCDVSVLKGIGGSEEAVIYLSRELVKLGREVTVYCNCGEMEGTYNGVKYLNASKFNPRDHFGILLAWRANIYQHSQVMAKKKIIWLHDVPLHDQFVEIYDEKKFDKVIVLSEYHKSLLPKNVPEDRIYVSTNGISASDFKGLDMLQRQKNRIIYASSYDRGLKELLEMWPEIRKEAPDAELHIFYGWNTYDEYVKLGYRDAKFKEEMLVLMDQPGVYECGRVSHRELLKEYSRSSVFAYPSNFVGEINCIALTKAIASGCTAVTNDFAVLGERNPHILAKDKNFSEAVVNALENPIKWTEEQKKEYVEANSWETVAKDWDENLFQYKRNTYKDIEDYRKEYSGPHTWKPCNLDLETDTLMIYDRYQFVIDRLEKYGVEGILDVGCCDGALCFAINSTKKVRADGIEVDQRGIDFANGYAKEKGYDCKFYQALIEEFKPKRKYNAVCMLEVLEHVMEPKKVIEKLDSIAGKDGYVFISTPDKNGPFGEDNFNSQHINHYDKESLAELVGKERIVEWCDSSALLQVVYKV